MNEVRDPISSKLRSESMLASNCRAFGTCVLLLAVGSACRSRPPEPEGTRAEPEPAPAALENVEPANSAPSAEPEATGASGASATAGAAATDAPTRPIPPGHRKVTAKPVADVPARPGDPVGGKFSLADATAGLEGNGALVAEIRTSLGKLSCELYEDRAPITVANFVGIARGLRPFKNPQGEWVKKPGYDGTTFHRIIRGFMVQGGDPAGSGAGDPGYVIPDEIWEDAYHSERGLLCMANRGPNTNAMQFFILDGSAPHLDGGYTIFGKCGPEAVLQKIAGAEVQGDRAVKPPKIEKVSVRRESASPKAK